MIRGHAAMAYKRFYNRSRSRGSGLKLRPQPMSVVATDGSFQGNMVCPAFDVDVSASGGIDEVAWAES